MNPEQTIGALRVKRITRMIDCKHLYKEETGSFPAGEYEFDVYRSKGRWILDISDESKIELFGNCGTFVFPDQDYVEWLENKIEELLTLK